MKKETLEEAAKNYGWRIKRNSFSDKVKANELAESAQQDFITGAKWQAEGISLMEIELNHTKTLLESCEKALDDRDKKAQRMYSKEEVLEHLNHLIMMSSSELDKFTDDEEMVTIKWFEQFKKEKL